MAVNDDTTMTPNIPDVAALDLTRAEFCYDHEADTLIVHLYGRDREAEIVPGDGWVDLRVDPETYDLVGLQIEGYLSDAIYEAPRLIGLAMFAGISSTEIETLQKRRAVLAALLDGEALLTA